MTTDTGPHSSVPPLTVYRFRLHLAMGARRHTLPAYLGSTVRGVFAAAFRQVVCVTGAPVCNGCALLDRCAYPYVFETLPPAHLPGHLQKRFRQAPRPYMFEVPLLYDQAERLELGLVLIGRAIDFLPYFLYVVQEMGQHGLGSARVPYRLLEVSDAGHAGGATVYRAEEGIVCDQVQGITLSDLQPAAPSPVRQITLTFLTPLRLKKYGGYQADSQKISFAALIDLLLGRLESLALFHCGALWRPDTALREAAQHVQVVSTRLSFQPLERYSNRRQQKLPLHGLVGTMGFAGELEAFVPLLRMGEYVHVGSGTAFGLGQYRLGDET